MNVSDVMDALGDAMGTIPGVRVFPYWADRIVPPAAVVSWPSPLSYDATYGGSDRYDMPLTLLVGKVNARASRDALAQYLARTGAESVKAVIESHDSGGVWGSVRVTQADVSVVSVAGVDYLGAEFTLDVIGK